MMPGSGFRSEGVYMNVVTLRSSAADGCWVTGLWKITVSLSTCRCPTTVIIPAVKFAKTDRNPM